MQVNKIIRVSVCSRELAWDVGAMNWALQCGPYKRPDNLLMFMIGPPWMFGYPDEKDKKTS